MLSRPINLAIVDDHALFRKTLKQFLSEQDDMNVAVLAANTSDLFVKLTTSSIDVLLMDIFLPEPDSNEVLKIIRSKYSGVKVVALSMSTDMDLISDMLDAGVHAYISKADEPEELLLAIRTAADNRIYRNRLFTEALYWNKQNNIRDCNEKSHILLNDREKRILQLIWDEKSNKEIADELFLGVRSVEKIRQELKEKICVRSTVGLLKYGIRKRLIDIESMKGVQENMGRYKSFL
jgi:DNA-binding NarL/FixJ family response regulator